VSARLGHASIRTTQEIYALMIHGQDDAAAEAWEKFQKQPTGGEPQQKGRVQRRCALRSGGEAAELAGDPMRDSMACPHWINLRVARDSLGAASQYWASG
jgi:hypothetical protein